MSGAFPISTSKFETLGIKSIQSTIISKSISGKKLSSTIDSQRWAFTASVSYTHLTLPTISSV